MCVCVCVWSLLTLLKGIFSNRYSLFFLSRGKKERVILFHIYYIEKKFNYSSFNSYYSEKFQVEKCALHIHARKSFLIHVGSCGQAGGGEGALDSFNCIRKVSAGCSMYYIYISTVKVEGGKVRNHFYFFFNKLKYNYNMYLVVLHYSSGLSLCWHDFIPMKILVINPPLFPQTKENLYVKLLFIKNHWKKIKKSPHQKSSQKKVKHTLAITFTKYSWRFLYIFSLSLPLFRL